MNTVNQTITIDLLRPGTEIIHAKQDDALTRKLTIHLKANGTAYEPGEGVLFAVQYRKADGKCGLYTKLRDGTTDAVTASGSALNVTFDDQVFTAAGRVSCSISMFTEAGEKIQTFSFFIDVEESETPSGYVSEDYFNYPSLKSLADVVKKLEEEKAGGKYLKNFAAALEDFPDGDGLGLPVYNPLADELNDFVPMLIRRGADEAEDEDVTVLSKGATGEAIAQAVAKVLPSNKSASACAYSSATDTYSISGDAFPTVVPGSDSAHEGKTRQIILVPSATNTTNAPKLSINGDDAVGIRLRASKNQSDNTTSPDATVPVPVGALIKGAPYTLTFCGMYWLIDSMISNLGGELKPVKTVNGQAPDEKGNVEITIPESGQNLNPVAKTDDMTRPVGVDKNGQLWVAPIYISGGGSNSGNDSGGENEGDEPVEAVKQELTFVTGKLSSGVFTPDVAYAANCSTVELIDATKGDMKVVFPYSAEYCSADTGDLYFYICKYDANDNFIEYVKLDGSTSDTSWQTIAINSENTWRGGFKYRLVFKRGILSSNSNMLKWVHECLEVYVLSAISSDHETMSIAQEVDNDYLQDYDVSTMSLTTNNVDDPTTFEGVLEIAKNEWMLAYGGDMNKIPVIVHTDQHSYLARGKECGEVFDTISSMVNWYDISKVINLGDTINSFPDPDNLTAGSNALENYLDSMREVPFSKRIEIFGNHDAMWMNGAVLTAIYHDQSYLQPYFRNIFARKTNNNGYFVVKDDNFNVKYVVISCFEFDETWANKYVISSEQIEWLIAELSKADGYDVILLSHVPVDGDAWGKADISAIVSARRDKTSGTITDAYNVSHSFDFSGCDGELVCSLHGHSHNDKSGYNGNVLYNVFSNFYASPKCLYFVLIDRANRQLNIWKIDNAPQYSNYQIPLDKPTE